MPFADVVFHGGSVFTAGQSGSRRADLAVRGGLVAAIGTAAELSSLIGPETRVVDAGDQLVLPGFLDAHVHPVMGGIELLQCNLVGAVDADDCLRIIAAYAASHPDEPWILGGGWSMDSFPGGTPTAALLDRIVPDRPVLLMNRDHHGSWVNSRALELAGIDVDTPDPVDGRIERDAAGAPSGTLHEGATELLAAVRPAIDDELAYRGLLRGQQELFSHGVTGWQDALVGAGLGMPDTLDLYLRALRRGELRGRVSAALWWERHGGDEQLASLIARRDRVAAAGAPERLIARTVKIMVDGVAENFTAAMTAPYLDGHGHSTDNAGLSFIDVEKLKHYVQLLDAADFQLHFHALGDRAVREALDALEFARSMNGPSEHRHQLAHLQVVSAADVPRFAELDATANLQALWACREQQLLELTFPFLEPDLIEQHYPFGSLVRAGTRLAAGSDWPVSSANPMLAVHVAVTRVAPGGDDVPLGAASEQLSLATALTAYTSGSARAGHREGTSGRLAVGVPADLAVLDRDPFDGDARDIHRATVVSTWIDGANVFDRTG